MQTAATHSADLRLHDKEEIARLERKVGIAIDTVDGLNHKICDLEKQGQRLAKSLGFETVYAAQAFIDLADDWAPYKDLAERIEKLQTDLSLERKDNEKMRAELRGLQVERDALKAKIGAFENSPTLSAFTPTHQSPPKSDSATQKQLNDLQRRHNELQRRYDEMKVVKERAEDKYKADYRKMNATKVYLRSEEVQEMEDQLKEDYPTLSTSERKRRRAEIISIKEKKIAEFDKADQDHSTVNLSGDKENQQMPAPETRKRHISIAPSSTGSPVAVVSQSTTKLQPAREPPAPPLVKTTAASSLSTSVGTPRVPLHFQPIDNGVRVKSQLSSPASVILMDGGAILIPNSSDVEEDPYRGPDPFATFKLPRVPVPARPAVQVSSDSSETEEDSSQDPYPFKAPPAPVLARAPTQEDRKHAYLVVASGQLLPLSQVSIMASSASTPKPKLQLASHSALPPHPSSLQFTDQRSKSRTRHSDGVINTSTTDANEQRPRKIRRVSSPGPGPNSAQRISIGGELGASAAKPLYVGSGNTPRRMRDREASASTGRRIKGAVMDQGKRKQPELLAKLETSTPVANARASSSKQLADYSGYKGRGRYANDGAGDNMTINTDFAIDPARNGGRDFQYDEVVRGREDRRHLVAGDCECCRDYYDAIGPMPKRLQAPLWRTPPSSPRGPNSCLRTGSAQKESADITSHKQAISRHRHPWARGSTPPGYWTIGFPSTQEAADINEKAREMHHQKKKNVQEEADRGGRYKKR
ncbi:DNA repair protein endonuclease SAE2/CtIP C-terminus-domain-containing protein [Mycena epipterygia]|nr:DNA repair protein endonuclease SAE2/CtIP C-terminus-domain-containing protein [Mycena epipterygia]